MKKAADGTESQARPAVAPAAPGKGGRVAAGFFGLLAWSYPLAVWLQHTWPCWELSLLSYAILLALLARFILGFSAPKRLLVCSGLGMLAIAIAAIDAGHVLRLYPFLLSSATLLLFIQAKRPEDNPMLLPVRRRAARQPELIAVLHRAKSIWIAGLAINSAVFFCFLFAFSTASWTLYASFYSYLLLLFLFVLTALFVAYARRSEGR